MTIFGFVFWTICPCVKFLFVLTFGSGSLVLVKCINHPLAVFPIVGNAGISGCVIQANFVVVVHVFFHHIHAQSRAFYPSRIGKTNILLYAFSWHPSVGAPWIAQNHREITCFNPTDVNWQMVIWIHRNVIFRVFSRISVLVGIYSKNRKITRVAWPFPIVGIATIFSNAIWRCAYQAYVCEILVNKVIKLISLKKRLYGYRVFSIFVIFLLDFSNFLVDGFFTIQFTHAVIYLRQNALGNIIHSDKKSNRQAFGIAFF